MPDRTDESMSSRVAEKAECWRELEKKPAGMGWAPGAAGAVGMASGTWLTGLSLVYRAESLKLLLAGVFPFAHGDQARKQHHGDEGGTEQETVHGSSSF